MGADEPDHGANVGVEGGHAVRDLGAGNDHQRAGSLLRPPSRMSPTTPMIWRAASVELRADAFADEELLANGVVFGPEFFLHGLVDENHARGGAGVLLGEVAALQDGNVEDR